jgi:uncharacterized membrane protein
VHDPGWDAAALVYLAWTWSQIVRADCDRTAAAVAVREDGSRALTDFVLILAAVASLAGVGDVIMLGAAKNDPISPGVAIALAITSVVLSWAVVHTIFTLRYARLYYAVRPPLLCRGSRGHRLQTGRAAALHGLRLPGLHHRHDVPGLRHRPDDATIRAAVLRHALLSYLFGAVISAVTINLVAGLSK